MLRNQKGFTLIEIIAVLVILGVLAAVAIPKYINLQAQAQCDADQGAIAALQSTVTQGFAQQLLNGASNGTQYTAPSGSVNVGDFWGNITIVAGGQINVSLAGVSTGNYQATGGNASCYSKLFNLW